MRIVFMGTPDFAMESLYALCGTENEIVGVVTNVDKKQGRGMKVIYSPVKQLAIERNLKLFQPEKLRNNEEFINQMKELQPDLFCVVAYGKILPKELLDIPKYGSVNVHGSILPKYRGACPVQWAVINGDKETGISTMFMDEGMDSGDIILQENASIDENETFGEVWKRLSKLGGQKLVETVKLINDAVHNADNLDNIKEKIKQYVGARKQGDDYTIASMINKEISKINWDDDSKKIKNLVRGLNPEMGAYTIRNNHKFKIWKVESLTDEQYSEITDRSLKTKNVLNGDVILSDKKIGLFIKAGHGIIQILEIQPDNGKKMDISSFLNGYNF